MYRSGNPALNSSTFEEGSYPDKPWWEAGGTYAENIGMTIEGVAEKGAVTFLLFMTSGMTIWGLGLTGQPEMAIILASGGFILNAIFSMILFWSWFTPSFQGLFANPLFVLTYATSQGLLVGGMTYLFEYSGGSGSGYQGITIQAFLITGMIFGAMLGVYRSGLINVNDNFRIALYSAVFGVMMVYLLSFILMLFGVSVPLIHGSGPIGIV
ncbi:MAG: Bax inhibitor-1/YccA family protein, partial [Euryarchaeota archaeon]|nr:Bax inhibitor-1/YccA family protein [Euryarchaeota archaeon]